MMHGIPFDKMKIIFEEIKFLRATSMQKNQDILITITIHRGTALKKIFFYYFEIKHFIPASGKFEIIEGKSGIAEGTIKHVENYSPSDITPPEKENATFLQEADFYKEMRLRGYYHRKLFRAVKEIREDGLTGKIKWNSDWTTFMDCLIQFQVLLKDTRMLILPTSIRKVSD